MTRFGLVRAWPWWKDLLAAAALALLIVAIALLAACQSAPPERDPQDDAFQAHLAHLQDEMDAKRMTRKEAAVSARARARALFNDPYVDELWSYRVALADQVERGQTTLEQAAYLDQQKANELLERAKASTPSGHRPAFRPAMTCRPDAFGGVRCR